MLRSCCVQLGRMGQDDKLNDALGTDIDFDRSTKPRGLKGTCCKGYCTVCCGLAFGFISLILLVVVLPVSFLSIGPALLSQTLRDAQVEVITMHVTKFEPDGKTLFVAMEGKVGAGLPVSAHVAATTVSMAFGGFSFMDVPFPEMTIAEGVGAHVTVNALAIVTDQDAFTSFTSTLLNHKQVGVELRGSITISVLGIGFHNVKMATPITLNGLDSFKENPPKVVSYDVVSTEENALTMSAKVQMHNPSVVGFDQLGSMVLQVLYGDVFLGEATAFNTSLLPLTDNLLECSIALQRNELNAASMSAILSGAMNGVPIYLRLKGTQASTTVSLMKDSIATLDTQSVMEPLPQMPLLKSGYNVIPTDAANMPHNTELCHTLVSPYLPTLNGLFIGANVVVVNPLSAELILHTMDVKGTWEVNYDICPTAFEDAQACNATGIDSVIPFPMVLFQTPSVPVTYDFHVPPNIDGTVLNLNMCFPQSLLSGFLCGLNTVFLKCLNDGYHRDPLGTVPFEIFTTLAGTATASLGNFGPWPGAPLQILRKGLPLLMRSPCGNTTTLC